MKNDYLRIIWYKRLSKYSDNTALINGTFDELLKNYNSGKRYYHDLTHVIDLLKLMEQVNFQMNDEEVMYFAIWFHDAIYDPLKQDNELKSADWAKRILSQTNFPEDKIEKVCHYIMSTKDHESSGEHDLNFFLDFDLSILGAEDMIYDIYARQIRDEYHFYPGFLYNRGRRKVLNALLEKPSLFHTDDYKNRLEEKAKINMRRELDNL
jgi:predicted metal-dependent HD superfamily phosphohydrolase